MLPFSKNRTVQDTLILLGSGLTFLFILPISIYRFLEGDAFVGTLDLVVSFVFLGLFFQAWYSIKVKYLSYIVISVYMISTFIVVYLKTAEAIFWTFPAIIATYFLLSSYTAVLLNSLFTAIVIGITFLKDPSYIGFYPAVLLVGVFGFMFSARSENQNKELIKLVAEDTLTKLKNRRSFDEKIEEVLAQNKRSYTPVCLLLLDLDYFKNVNDNHGHKQGDIVLYDFAQTVKSMIRNTDYIYRIGGEEFAVIVTNSVIGDAGVFADNIRDAIQKTPCLSKFNMTTSIGVSEIKQCDDEDSCFRRADLALYESKSRGRNRTFIAEQDANGRISFSKVAKKNLKVYPSSKTNSLKGQHAGESSTLLHAETHGKTNPHQQH